MKRHLKTKQKIKMWLIRNSIKQTDIAADLTISRQAVWQWVNGCVKSKRIACWFKENGLPEGYFEGKRNA
ncbi:MAG: hypothetical protein GY749_44590 [Desulfobacteraceae bacterium]|nr:hypothetical protein [Desulfobacteraceae bacterium]